MRAPLVGSPIKLNIEYPLRRRLRSAITQAGANKLVVETRASDHETQEISVQRANLRRARGFTAFVKRSPAGSAGPYSGLPPAASDARSLPQLAQFTQLAYSHSRILPLPQIVRRLADSHFAADLGHLGSCFHLPQYCQDLLLHGTRF